MVKQKRTALIQVRVTPEEKREAEKTAEELRYSTLSAFVLDAVRFYTENRSRR
jgi:uncharacterized protein (DUF1778 family)